MSPASLPAERLTAAFRRVTDVYRPAPVEVVHLLTQGGVVAVEWEVPDELLEGPHPGPPICLDDLIDLHTAIAAHDAGATASDRAQPVAPVTSSAIERLTAAFRRPSAKGVDMRGSAWK